MPKLWMLTSIEHGVNSYAAAGGVGVVATYEYNDVWTKRVIYDKFKNDFPHGLRFIKEKNIFILGSSFGRISVSKDFGLTWELV